MSNVIKFKRTTQSGEPQEMVQMGGKLLTLGKTKANSNGTPYRIFTAQLDTPTGNMTVMGQVYEALFDYIGGEPQIGKQYAFASAIEHLQEGNNKFWNISGIGVDEVDETLISLLNQME